MPRITNPIDGIIIAIDARGEHNPPHVRVEFAEFDVKLKIMDGSILSGGKNFPTKKLKIARKWLTENQQECLNKWKQINPHLRA